MRKKPFITILLVALACFALLTSRSFSVDKRTNGLIVLLTDFGQSDYYVGALKGTIYSIYPEAKLDDITHQVTPYNIWEGAYTLSLAAKEFPKGTVFVAVVDPGVGTERKAIVLETRDGKFFVAPDNGLLTFVAQEMGEACVRRISNRAYMRPMKSFSTTFHGRDIFGPVGAHLAAGIPISEFGPETKVFMKLKIPRAEVRNGKILGQVVRVDTYGNVVTNISDRHLNEAGIKRGDIVRVTLSKHTLHVKFVSTYGDVPRGEKLCLLDSRGLLELAINMAHLADTLGVRISDEVIVDGK